MRLNELAQSEAKLLRDRACPGVENGAEQRVALSETQSGPARSPLRLLTRRETMGVERAAFAIGPVLAPLVRRYTHKRTRDTADHALMTDNLMAFMHKASAPSLDPPPRRYRPTPA